MSRTVRLRLLTAACALGLAATGLHAPAALGKDKAPPAHEVSFTAWDFGDGDPGGGYDGTVHDGGTLTLGSTTTTRDYDDPHDQAGAATYDVGTWTSPVVDPDFGLTELVASWNAHTPGGSWLEISVQATDATGTASKWYHLGRWAEHDDRGFHPTSVPAQGDEQAYVAIDTLVAREGVRFDSFRIRLSLLRPVGSTTSPTVGFAGAMASYVNVPKPKQREVSATTMEHSVELDVPTYSQETHIGHFPQYDNGGEAWCSPTSTTMVLRYWDETAPHDADYSWVYAEVPDERDPYVDYAARHTYDYNYDGAGNWPFNTAYAARYGNEAFVTRLRDLAEAEQLVKAGIPVVVSMSFKESKLDGAGYGTNGHLLTIVGFQRDGDVIVNDPASHLIPDNSEVRVVYDRAQFETAWIGSTGGISYVIHPESAPLPGADEHGGW
jgi:hypothetical protein